MSELPATHCVPVVRADFSDDQFWAQLKEEITSPTEEGFLANVEFVEDRTLEGLEEAVIVAGFPRAYPYHYRHPVLFVVDSVTVSSAERPLLVVNLNEWDPSRPFRAVPRQVQSIENNLSIANMDFFEFARSVDADGVFRGF
ncbi:DUF6924 domain-containing protein [Saccharomonospora cyanea]|uniref:DUF6924 domain-containing protein n=1 Tax=Saccharomonospora cyanea NA-134 TaxID=882082 RepID=H5XG85_9PSEU|nr:hypothetical protein [Saccharomonospora cyanea]EHR62667.1 hypothetical protein SaccyDRAFT_3842 [Saccharomonospora cyanea NA-134]